MPSFKYSAIGSDGRTIQGKIDASSRAECVAELRKRVYILEQQGHAVQHSASPHSIV